jgi:hypothetical protein
LMHSISLSLPNPHLDHHRRILYFVRLAVAPYQGKIVNKEQLH